MAAKTPTSVTKIGPVGIGNLYKAVFADIDDGDTWASGFPNAIAKWASVNENPTTQAAVGCATTFSSGTFTFYPAEDNAVVDLFIIAQE